MSWPGKIACSALVLGAVAAVWPHEPPRASAPPPAHAATVQPDTSRFEPSWWQTDEARCADGARLYGGAPPDGDQVWCASADGVRHGQHIGWWRNGRKAFHRHYRAGRLHGLATEWNEDGSVLSYREYRDGLVVDDAPRTLAGTATPPR